MRKKSICIVAAFGIPAMAVLFILGISLSEALFESEVPVVELNVIAHRGLHGQVPENTLEAVDAAIKAGIEKIEIDIHQTADGVLVLNHDYTVRHPLEGDKRIGNLTYMQLADIKWTAGRHNYRIPALEKVLRAVDGRAKLIVELKEGSALYPNIVLNTVQLIRSENAAEWVSVHSFKDDVLEEFHRIAPEIELHKLMVACFPQWDLVIDHGIHLKDLEQYHFVDVISLHYAFANRGLVKSIHERNQRVHVWNLNDADLARKLTKSGVDAIITDRPELLQE